MKAFKRIISTVLVMLLLIPAAIMTAGAQEGEVTFSKDKYKEEIYAAIELTEFEKSRVEYTYLFEYNADNSPTSDEATPDYVVARIDDVFAWDTDGAAKYIVGTYHLGYYKSNAIEKADYYIYSTAEGIAYTPHELYWKQPENWQFALDTLEGGIYKYRSVFEEYVLEKRSDITMKDWPHYARGYEELYYHYETEPTCDEATPDYVLIYGFTDMTPSYAYGVFGDYIVSGGYASPYALPYYVIVPKENCKVYTLREAYDAGLEGIENAFNVYKINALGEKLWVAKQIGDADNDREITVKDATFIQKCLAGLQYFPDGDEVWGHCETPGFGHLSYEYTDYISDFNRDGERNIRDATAIQKYIAGFDY
ncbi:MAG: dockerin type I repeat-containing protein [Ruminococcus sp.]|nr:dockerin type I repeat-containing protein [Ruminococcus sp.]